MEVSLWKLDYLVRIRSKSRAEQGICYVNGATPVRPLISDPQASFNLKTTARSVSALLTDKL